MIELTDRQTQILKAIIEEYIETAQPVGSETLEKKYNLGVSPATIRNEMVRLTKMGLLKQLHTSSGRTPTPLALRYYINRLMEVKQLAVADEVAVKEKVWDFRHQTDQLIREITKVLAEKTRALAVAVTNERNIYHSGYANILDLPEFFDIDVTKHVLSIIEDFEKLNNFFNRAKEEEIVYALFGDDFGSEELDNCGMVYTNFNIEKKLSGSLGVIGSCRLHFSQVIPTVKYCANLLEELLGTK